MIIDNVKKEAFSAMKNAYAPYSNCHVGAAILMNDGKIITGCNVENASYGLTVCAERVTIFSAISCGYTKDSMEAMVLVSDFKGDTRPCGACRQVLSELYPSDKPIYMLNKDNTFTKMTIKDLLPYSFDKDDLK